MAAWTEPFTFPAETFISTEPELRVKLDELSGFEGMIDMRIASKNDEGSIGFLSGGYGATVRSNSVHGHHYRRADDFHATCRREPKRNHDQDP